MVIKLLWVYIFAGSVSSPDLNIGVTTETLRKYLTNIFYYIPVKLSVISSFT